VFESGGLLQSYGDCQGVEEKEDRLKYFYMKILQGLKILILFLFS
jgi:hypothetical protein